MKREEIDNLHAIIWTALATRDIARQAGIPDEQIIFSPGCDNHEPMLLVCRRHGFPFGVPREHYDPETLHEQWQKAAPWWDSLGPHNAAYKAAVAAETRKYIKVEAVLRIFLGIYEEYASGNLMTADDVAAMEAKAEAAQERAAFTPIIPEA